MDKQLKLLVKEMDMQGTLFNELLDTLPDDEVIINLLAQFRTLVERTEQLAINLNSK